MNKKTTPSLSSSVKPGCSASSSAPDGKPHPSEKTVAFLRSFARNYHVEPQLPQGLQGIILG